MKTPERDRALDSLCLELLDLCQVLRPRGWRQIELRRDAFGALNLIDQRDGEGVPVPRLGVPEEHWLSALGANFGELTARLGRRAPEWSRDALSVSAVGADGLATVRAIHEGREVAAHELGPEQSQELLLTEPLFQWLDELLPRVDALQTKLEGDLHGHDDWAFDQNTLELTLARGALPWRQWRASLLGTWAEESGTLLWGWANRHVAPTCTQAIRAFRGAVEGRAGFNFFRRAETPMEEALAATLASCASAELGARGMYRASYGPGMLYLAVQ